MCDFLWGMPAVGCWAGQIPQQAGLHVTDLGMHENEPTQDQDQTDSQEYNSDKTNLLFSKKNNKSIHPIELHCSFYQRITNSYTVKQ